MTSDPSISELAFTAAQRLDAVRARLPVGHMAPQHFYDTLDWLMCLAESWDPEQGGGGQ
jgi:hypothetical protein